MVLRLGVARARYGAPVLLILTLLGGLAPAAAFEQPVSAFAAAVGARDSAAEGPAAITLYVVPDGRTLLLTDILVANYAQEPGPLYLGDSKGTRCSVALLQNMIVPNNPLAFNTFMNVHTSFTTGIPFGPGEPVVASLVGGNRGVDVTITGRLVPGPRLPTIRLPGGARGPDREAEPDH
jgi:hypothetical protein